MVVVATQGHGDEEAVEQAVAAYPAFVGLVASRKRGEAVLGYLADRGVPQDLLDRVRVPVGLDLGHTSHREIAVAILAELRAAAGAPAGCRPVRPQREAAAVAGRSPAEAIDPVCGMTVTGRRVRAARSSTTASRTTSAASAAASRSRGPARVPDRHAQEA